MNLLTDLGTLTAAHDLARRIAEGTLITPLALADGTSLFVWQGRADSVHLRTWMPRFPPVPPFRRLPGADLWVLGIPLPSTAMIEYRVVVVRGGRPSETPDPLNPDTTTNPFGTNSLATGTAYVRPEWAEFDPAVPAGTVSEIRVQSSVWGERRHHLLYLPAGHRRHEPTPVVFVHDGPDFVDHSALSVVLDNLIAAGDLPPLIAVLHQPRQRLTEYAHDQRHASHAREILEHLSRRFTPDGRFVALGSSLGAVAALSLGWHMPDVTGLGLLSGSFALAVDPDHPAEIFAPVADLVGGIGSDDRLVGRRVYVSCGRYEGLIDVNRSMAPRLRAAGTNVRYEETWDGHQWASWRDRLRAALTHALGLVSP